MDEFIENWSWLFWLLVIGGIGYWLFSNYEVREVSNIPTEPVGELTPLPQPRPTGELYLTTLESGEEWRLDAESAKGPRTARMVWVIADHAENKSVAFRRTKTLLELDCNKGGYITRSVINYDKGGNVVDSWGDEAFSDTTSFAPPSSNIERVFIRACSTEFSYLDE